MSSTLKGAGPPCRRAGTALFSLDDPVCLLMLLKDGEDLD